MKLEDFLLRRRQLELQGPRYRELCSRCLQPGFGCYCAHVQNFDPQIKFAILIHPIEVRRRIATGRMSYLSLRGSELIHGQDYSQNEQVNSLILDPQYQPMILYPGPQSQNLSPMTMEQRQAVLSPDRTPLIFVIDGTWATARKMMRLSENLKQLPRISFTPDKPSNFRVRKQPKPGCYSTIEAIHYLLDLMGPRPGFDHAVRPHDGLLRVFDTMVERQLDFIRESRLHPERCTYRHPKNRKSGTTDLPDSL